MNLKIENLSKKFGEKSIFKNFSFDFPKIGICSVIGPSGIGKTTLLRIIAGLDKEYSGTIQNAGIGNVSYMFQEYRLFPIISALKNVVAVTNETEADQEYAKNMLLRLGFTDKDLQKKPKQLSGGMKQRVAFARAVAKPSPILILDEPTKELDDASIAIMAEIIREEATKRLVLIVTHDDVEKISESHITLSLH